MPYVKIWIHLIWATKRRAPFLSDSSVRYRVFEHIFKNADKKDIQLDFVNGWVDHVHCLLRLKHTQSVAQVAKLIKGESSHWINEQKLIADHFQWQDQYMAISVSESIVPRVRAYIKNQAKHHQKKCFEDEMNQFVDTYGFTIVHDDSD